MRKVAFLLLGLLILLASSGAEAAHERSRRPRVDVSRPADLGEINRDITEATEEIVEVRIEELNTGTTNSEIRHYVTGDYHWKLTAAVLNGIQGLDRIDDITEAAKKLNRKAHEESRRKVSRGSRGNLGDAAPLMRQNAKLDEVRDAIVNLNGLPGFNGSSIYDSSLKVAFALWILFSVLRMSYIPLRMIQGEKIYATNVIQDMARIGIIFVSLLFLKQFIIIGISISDGIKALVADSGSTTQSTFDIFHDVLDARFKMLGLENINILTALRNTGSYLMAHLFGWLSYYLAQLVIWVLLTLGDILMALTALVGPWTLALSLLPTFESYPGTWLKSYITLLFWGPLAAIYSIMAIMIMAIGMDTSAWAFIVISIAYLMGSIQVPNVAKGMSAAALSGVAVAVASMPMHAAKGAARGALS